MQVIFLTDVKNVATAGDIKKVSNGFARNYLIPQGLATVATSEKLKGISKIRRTAQERRTRETTEWTGFANNLEGTSLNISGRVGPTGQFYGAISVTQILQELTAKTGLAVERRAIELPEPLKEPGTYEITLNLHQYVQAKIEVVAEAEE